MLLAVWASQISISIGLLVLRGPDPCPSPLNHIYCGQQVKIGGECGQTLVDSRQPGWAGRASFAHVELSRSSSIRHVGRSPSNMSHGQQNLEGLSFNSQKVSTNRVVDGV